MNRMTLFNPHPRGNPRHHRNSGVCLFLARISAFGTEGGHKQGGPFGEPMLLIDIQHGMDALIHHAKGVAVLL